MILLQIMALVFYFNIGYFWLYEWFLVSITLTFLVIWFSCMKQLIFEYMYGDLELKALWPGSVTSIHWNASILKLVDRFCWQILFKKTHFWEVWTLSILLTLCRHSHLVLWEYFMLNECQQVNTIHFIYTRFHVLIPWWHNYCITVWTLAVNTDIYNCKCG